MGVLKTFPGVGLIWLLMTGGGAAQGRDDPVTLFATCAGRLSAIMEHQWLVDGPASEITARHRQNMVEMLEAVTPAGAGRQVLALRIEAKMALAALLTRATFNDDTQDMARAQRLAVTRVSACAGLLLS